QLVAYETGKVAEAVSLGFLFCWMGGDLTNFTGCHLTNQLPIQVFTAIFYMNIDIIMPSFTYYKLKNQKKKSKEKLLKGLHFCHLYWSW
uniref:Uncharacterized protein n=1 Tax=Microcebus murinus TaxID=30608 RepID=A0A8C5YHR2_MICMU